MNLTKDENLMNLNEILASEILLKIWLSSWILNCHLNFRCYQFASSLHKPPVSVSYIISVSCLNVFCNPNPQLF